MTHSALSEYAFWCRDPQSGGGCWCNDGPCGNAACPNMPRAVHERGERLWRRAGGLSGREDRRAAEDKAVTPRTPEEEIAFLRFAIQRMQAIARAGLEGLVDTSEALENVDVEANAALEGTTAAVVRERERE